MWKVLCYTKRACKAILRTLKIIVCSKTFRWVVIVGGVFYTLGYSMEKLQRYMEKLLVLTLDTANMPPISAILPSIRSEEDTLLTRLTPINCCGDVLDSMMELSDDPEFPDDEILDLDFADGYFEFWPWRRVAHIMRFGYPGMDTLRHYDSFIVSYDKTKRIPHWVYEHIHPDVVFNDGSFSYRQFFFQPDQSIRDTFRLDESVLKTPGYFMRQLVSVPNHWKSEDSVKQTFLFTNIVPQRGDFALPVGDVWARLDQRVRDLSYKYLNVYSCTGPLFLPHKARNGKTYVKYEVIGENDVAVPTHMFKVVMAETKTNEGFEMWCYLMDNKIINDPKKRLEDFYVDPIRLEKASGLLFLNGIPLVMFKKVNGKPNPGAIP